MQGSVVRGVVQVSDPKTRSVLLLRDLAAIGRERQMILILDNALVVGRVTTHREQMDQAAQSVSDAFGGLSGARVVAQDEERFAEAVVVYDAKVYPFSQGPVVEAEVLVVFPETIRAVAVGVARAVQE